MSWNSGAAVLAIPLVFESHAAHEAAILSVDAPLGCSFFKELAELHVLVILFEYQRRPTPLHLSSPWRSTFPRHPLIRTASIFSPGLKELLGAATYSKRENGSRLSRAAAHATTRYVCLAAGIILSKARSTSRTRSSMSSIPTDKRTSPRVTPSRARSSSGTEACVML